MQKKAYYKARYLQPSIVKYYLGQIGRDVKKVLDLGCGNGCIGRLKPKEEVEVYGLDIDKTGIAEASIPN